MTVETQPYKDTQKEVMSELVRVCEQMWVKEATGGRPDVADEWRLHSAKIKNNFDPDMYPYPQEVLDYIEEKKAV